MPNMTNAFKKIFMSYLGLVFVIFVWGIAPFITLELYKYYSPTISIALSSLIGAVILVAISWKKRHLLNKTYFKVAIPTGFFFAIAHILQKIGLQYTSPTHYAFLENLSVLVVPALMFFFIKKKPGFLTVFSALLCLASCFILTGLAEDKNSASLLGDILCAVAGIFYGVNIAGTGAFAKKFYAPWYLAIQTIVKVVVSLAGAIMLDFTGIEKLRFDFSWQMILANVVIVLSTSTLCWIIRINAMKHVDTTVVAVMMPFSSIVTTFLSIFMGNDTLTLNLVIGVSLGLIAIILSGLGDHAKKGKPKELACQEE